MVSLIAGIGIGISALLTGVTGGYFLFKESGKTSQDTIEEKGIINNVLQLEEHPQKGHDYTIFYLLVVIIVLLLINLLYNIFHCHRRKIKKKYIQRNIPNITEA